MNDSSALTKYVQFKGSSSKASRVYNRRRNRHRVKVILKGGENG